jgi:hypothetical protein
MKLYKLAFVLSFLLLNNLLLAQITNEKDTIIIIHLVKTFANVKATVNNLDKRMNVATNFIFFSDTTHDLEGLKSSYHITIDTSNGINQLNINLKTITMVTSEEFTAMIKKNGSSAANKQKHIFLLMSDFWGEVKIYRVWDIQTYYGRIE